MEGPNPIWVVSLPKAECEHRINKYYVRMMTEHGGVKDAPKATRSQEGGVGRSFVIASGSDSSAHTSVTTASLPDCGALDVFCLIHRVCGTLLSQLWHLNTFSQVNFLKITILLPLLSPR